MTKYCIGTSDCLLKVWTNGFVDQNNNLNLTIGFDGWSDTSIIQNNSVSIFEIVGIERADKNYTVYMADLTPSMKCFNGNKMNLYVCG